MPAFHGLHDADEIRDFLTKSADAALLRGVSEALDNAERMRNATAEQLDQIKDLIKQVRWQAPSAFSAIMLIVPMNLLRLSLNAFLIGLGIYFGEVYTRNLIPSYKSGNLAMLIIFVLITTLGVSMYYIPEGFKKLEEAPLERYNRLRRINDIQAAANARNATHTQASPNNTSAQSSSTSQSVHSRNGSGRVRYAIPTTDPEVLHPHPTSPTAPGSTTSDQRPSHEIPSRAPSPPQVNGADDPSRNSTMRGSTAGAP